MEQRGEREKVLAVVGGGRVARDDRGSLVEERRRIVEKILTES